MVTSCIERSHAMYETLTYKGPRSRSKTLIRNFMGHAKMHCPTPQMSSEELALELVKLGVKPYKPISLAA